MNLNKILFSFLVSTTLIAPLMAMEVMPQANPAQGQQMTQQQVLFHMKNGIIIDAATLVHDASLLLGDMNFTGNISTHIGTLYAVRHLSLCDNDLSGHIPPEVGHLHRLEYLNLSNNQLSGNITRDALSGDSLQYIDLNNNLLTGFDGRDLKRNTWILLNNNPIITFITNPKYECKLVCVPWRDRTLTNIHFDGSKIETFNDLTNLRGVLQQNVVVYNQYQEKVPLRIGFYKGNNDEPQYNISSYLQGFGVTHDTVIIKHLNGTFEVKGLMEGFEAKPLIALLENVRDMPEPSFGGKTKAARK